MLYIFPVSKQGFDILFLIERVLGFSIDVLVGVWKIPGGTVTCKKISATQATCQFVGNITKTIVIEYDTILFRYTYDGALISPPTIILQANSTLGIHFQTGILWTEQGKIIGIFISCLQYKPINTRSILLLFVKSFSSLQTINM